jgi:hypothetical protein
VSFYSRYQLEKLVADGPVKTFRALENATGRAVLLHLLDAGSRPLYDAIAAGCRDAQGQAKAPLIEMGEYAGSLYAVTETLDPFTDLRTWVARAWPGLLPAPPPPTAPETRSPSGPGEFTRMFALQGSGAVPVEVPPPAPPKREMGAFTAEFFARSETPPAIAPPVPAQPSAWPAPAPQQAPAPPLLDDLAKPSWPERAPAVHEHVGHENSDLFGTALKGEPVDVEAEQARAAKSAPPEEKPFRRAGTFTRMFGPGGPRDKSTTQEPRLLATTQPRSEFLAGAREASGAGEYTRMMKSPFPPEQHPAPPPPAVAVPAAPLTSGRDNRLLIVALVAIGVLLAAVIVLAAVLYGSRG